MSGVYKVEATPHPSRLLEGLRDTGYTFSTAVSDIVDNSIAAGATKVSITVKQNLANEISVKIADNGCGMEREELINAMTYGAPVRHNIHSLGKFGLGLKTASTSCCRRLKLISRAVGRADVNCAIWDLDSIRDSDTWDLELREADEGEELTLENTAGTGSGTLVVWEKVDRLLSGRYSNTSTPAYKAALQNSLIALRQHLAMVYQRFLDENDSRADNVNIILNGDPVMPWDPFCKELGEDVGNWPLEIKWNEDDGKSCKSIAQLVAYIVPNKSELETDELRQRVMPSYKNKALKGFDEESLSGFYIYRENRLLTWGQWFNMPNVDFHSKLCRFELSFGAELDDAFQVDIKKSRILMDDEIRDKLLRTITPIKNMGVTRYRGNTAKAAKKQGKTLHEQSNQMVTKQEPNVSRSTYGHDDAGRPTVRNRFGYHIAPYEEVLDPNTPLVEAVDSITDSALWAPTIAEGGHHGVQLNTSHPFYQRFYANSKTGGATDAMDLVFWALAEAESEAYEPEASENLEEARIATSRVLRKLSRDLPDASTEDFETRLDESK